MSRATPRPFLRTPLRVKNTYEHTDPDASEKHEHVFGTPPQKRAVPADEVHVRNVPAYASGKQSRVLYKQDATYGRAANPDETRVAIPSTTKRIDHATRMSREERYQRDSQKAQTQQQWRTAFSRAFPKLVFYLDQIEEGQKKVLCAQITQLGGVVEDFFSRSVTHVVTTRPIPAARSVERKKENDPAAARTPTTNAGVVPTRVLTPSKHVHSAVPLHSDRNPLDESGLLLPASDLLSKAQHFGMRIWRQDKLENILSLLLEAPAGEEEIPRDLSQMLHQEKLHGTTERDPLALRNDFHYFGKNAYYVLVTDATSEHRPVAMAEYDCMAHEATHKPAPWPVLFGSTEGRGLFAYVKPKERGRLARNEAPMLRTTHTLRRAASLNSAQMCRDPRESSVGPGTPNLMASDNSIALASAVASTTSATLHSQTGNPSGVLQDKRVAELNRRMHTPLGLRAPGTETQGAVVSRMLTLDREERAPLRRSRSTNTPLALPKRPREKRPGHCENCRCRYEDFDEHLRSRRHRKYALDEGNFVALDELLQRIQRTPSEAWEGRQAMLDESAWHAAQHASFSDAASSSTYDPFATLAHYLPESHCALQSYHSDTQP
ncbi:Cdc7p-Dbf4p kinase complex regulatory subunit [Malassezia vespertilionis]|uniref:DBF4-type domain-containing protein n=1 Tax=Malassezia vespertilionis TaxID=2020962 RepID=A0A2N1JAE1_9BASI|nr:Cdc7p-Dbf4p kinase complex regulatory subunit [Malassezia vespertilionis]PKI83515.1 hypothetical protein MVES_002463 [Malassezia vespertilionis]WFD07249.1 Cdc7p-Dbf4p kinase complex regulatory subunit [Malassezia vespertilionis]